MITPVVGLTVTVPWFGWSVIVTVVGSIVPSGSVSLPVTPIVTGVSSGVVPLSRTATGGSFFGVTMIMIGTVSHTPLALHATTHMVSVPFQLVFGV